MSKREPVDDPQIVDLENLAWAIKDDIASFYARSLPGTDRAALGAVKRDLERVRDRVRAILHKRKRDKADEPEAPAQQQELAAND